MPRHAAIQQQQRPPVEQQAEFCRNIHETTRDERNHISFGPINKRTPFRGPFLPAKNTPNGLAPSFLHVVRVLQQTRQFCLAPKNGFICSTTRKKKNIRKNAHPSEKGLRGIHIKRLAFHACKKRGLCIISEGAPPPP